MDNLLEVRGFCVFKEVNIGDLRDAHADESVGEITDGKVAVCDLEFMACVRARVNADTNSGSTGTGKERAAGKLGRKGNRVSDVLGREFGDGHSPL